MHRILSQMTRNRPEEQRDDAQASVDDLLLEHLNGTSLREEFEGLAESWTPPSLTGFELAAEGTPAP